MAKYQTWVPCDPLTTALLNELQATGYNGYVQDLWGYHDFYVARMRENNELMAFRMLESGIPKVDGRGQLTKHYRDVFVASFANARVEYLETLTHQLGDREWQTSPYEEPCPDCIEGAK